MATKGFDLTTQKLNKKGKVIANQPYRLFVENGVRKFERPVGSGIMYTENNELITSVKKEVKKPSKDGVRESLDALLAEES